MNRTGFITLIIIGMLMSGCKKETVDVILHSGRIYTMDEEFSTAEAMAV